VSSPNTSTGENNALGGVSCPSTGACTAVGYHTDKTTGQDQTLIESLAPGKNSWEIVSSPNPSTSAGSYLNGLSCVSSDSCPAVGYSSNQTLVESWDGTNWTIVPSANNANTNDFLYGVSCVTSSACAAVGNYSVTGGNATLTESWDGTSWTVAPSPNASGYDINFLNGVSCAASNSCAAVGYSTNIAPQPVSQTLIESWDGTSWTIVPNPNPSGFDNNQLSGVSCVASNDCTAVGSAAVAVPGQGQNVQTLVESWNGTSWTIVPSPNA
jgi:hypothetical protein